MSVLVGDVNGTGGVDGNDVSAVQSHTREAVNATTFRFDVNTTGGSMATMSRLPKVRPVPIFPHFRNHSALLD
jgi:hypothetical protein